MKGHENLVIAAVAVSIGGASSQTIDFTSMGNPILADGSYYSADPGPIVVDDTLYIISGQDSAAPDVNDFVINNWLLFSSKDYSPSGGEWTLHTSFEKPQDLFKWAAPAHAYASQIVKGPDDKFYLYAPVEQASTSSSDPFGIGVAVSSNITGPYVDAHPSGPIASQTVPVANSIENIDPTVLVDDDGKVYMYWGTFGELRGAELESDMVSFASDIVSVTTLDGFFEAPWIMKRNDVYYMLYADNLAGANSKCTPTSYHACIAYGTASSPLGPWTYQHVILPIVSSTTSHPGAVNYNDAWYLVYHTADAEGGGHFRRSLALDAMSFDDSKSPPSIDTVAQTHRPSASSTPTRNRQQLATAVSDPVCQIQYWIEAVHDQIVRANPLPPDYWSTWNGDDSVLESTITYSWNESLTLNGTAMAWFADHPAGATEGVAPPTAWHVEYLTATGAWQAVEAMGAYPLDIEDTPMEVGFESVETEGLRAVITASSNGGATAAVGVKEWYALAPTAE